MSAFGTSLAGVFSFNKNGIYTNLKSLILNILLKFGKSPKINFNSFLFSPLFNTFSNISKFFKNNNLDIVIYSFIDNLTRNIMQNPIVKAGFSSRKSLKNFLTRTSAFGLKFCSFLSKLSSTIIKKSRLEKLSSRSNSYIFNAQINPHNSFRFFNKSRFNNSHIQKEVSIFISKSSGSKFIIRVIKNLFLIISQKVVSIHSSFNSGKSAISILDSQSPFIKLDSRKRFKNWLGGFFMVIPFNNIATNNITGFIASRTNKVSGEIGFFSQRIVSQFVKFGFIDYLSFRFPRLLNSKIKSVIILPKGFQNILYLLFRNIKFGFTGLSYCFHIYFLSYLPENCQVKSLRKGGGSPPTIKIGGFRTVRIL
ncbi:MAG: hypothetical protein DDT41_01158 [candidate division WS2 bacterium]|nr:hypothetical protein [Candidatus Psychracetigena formicireducens]